MSAASRLLQPGDDVVTDYSGRLTRHKIVSRFENVNSQSRIMFLVEPPVPKSSGKNPIDADWFTPFGTPKSSKSLPSGV